ncbi:hypothetical protein MBM_01447 [Drepanopeziza brunnea f. sp. 'multigermtubi' MB_m1]|uniref:Uncharacterized protein n=1 Tax=Marssonina brunnea f. sp. multigermtubi (strain MB_m1) TaxID=1072389 RepID=K1WSZ3_MARBU|nr:uncharacterized protein MBM_01447 [Drepanopeziza brunnea f. sp. 'multigermtubi' MB_m1]EKD20765.1 hypothetical protein MBM_01447 [Drepanopeziza brunnea f. sp. 'multigermtubi' MB_m1]
MPFKQNPLSALAIAAVIAAAAAAVILRTLTFEPSPSLLDLLIKRLLMPTTVKALKYIKCINNKIISKFNKDCYNCDTSVIRYLRCIKGSYSNCIATFAAANTAFDNFLALDAALSRGAASSPSGLASKTFVRLNSLIITNRGPVTRNASSISLFPFALALAALIAPVALADPVALAAPVALVAFIIVAFFTLIVALTALAAALAVVITLAKRRAKVKRLLRALIDLLL